MVSEMPRSIVSKSKTETQTLYCLVGLGREGCMGVWVFFGPTRVGRGRERVYSLTHSSGYRKHS